MNAVRIQKHLDSAIEELPELTPLVGQKVEIIALAEQDAPQRRGVAKTQGVCGGSSCVGESRIPVWTLIQLKRLGRDEKQLLEDFPSLKPGDLDAAWDYYRRNTPEIERDIVEQEITHRPDDHIRRGGRSSTTQVHRVFPPPRHDNEDPRAPTRAVRPS